jgi:hypothetical protein
MRRALVQLPAQGDFVMGLSPSARELPITLELPASLQREIGKVVTRHATVELKLSRIVYILLGIDAVSGRISVREPRTTDRLDMIADLLKINKIKVQANLPAIRTDLDKCSLERDRLAHGIWIKDPLYPGKFFLRSLSGNWTPPGTREKSKRRIDPEAQEYNTKHAKDLVTLIEKTGQAVFDLGDEIDSALAASRNKCPRT